MKFNKILVSGCSFSAGFGFPGEHLNKQIWPNLLAEKLGAQQITNIARAGSNNHSIFLEASSAMICNNYDLVLVQWSSIPRFNFKVGLELYSVDSMLDRAVNIVNSETITKKWFAELKDRLLRLHNDHWDILNLIKYINILIEWQVKSRHGKIFFINGLGPWPDRYFEKKQISLPSDLDSFTHNMLQADIRDDREIYNLYEMIHDHYRKHGGIQEKHWLNLYQPMTKLKIDTIAMDDEHPGVNSQFLFADIFAQQITNKCVQPQS